MTKDPAFLFYYQDFAYGTRRMTFEEKGAYIELLCEQADRGHLPLPYIKKILQDRLDLWETIQSKFKKDDQDLFYNQVLEDHQIKRKTYSESRRKNIAKRYAATHVATQSLHNSLHTPDSEQPCVERMKDHMVNENVNVNGNTNVIKKEAFRFTKPAIEEVLDYADKNDLKMDCQEFYDHYESNGWRVGNNPMKDWKASARNWARRDSNRGKSEMTNAQKRTLESWRRWKKNTKDEPDEEKLF